MARKSKRKAARRPARKSSRSKPARKAPKSNASKSKGRRPAKKPARRARPRAKPRRPAPRAASPSRRSAQPSMKTIERDRRALKLASLILGFFAFAHLVRFITEFTLRVDGFVLPLNVSGVIVILFGVLSVWYYRLSLD